MNIILGYDPLTLREQVDLQAIKTRLHELGKLRTLSALSERTVLLRLGGQLEEALLLANEALRQARFTGNREDAINARIRRAQVLHYQDKFDEAFAELSSCIDEARLKEWTELEALGIQCRGKMYFELGDYPNALSDLSAAVFLREKLGASPNEIQGALAVVALVQERAQRESKH